MELRTVGYGRGWKMGMGLKLVGDALEMLRDVRVLESFFALRS